MRQFAKSMVILAAFITTAMTAFAAKMPYVRPSDEGKTLTYFYNDGFNESKGDRPVLADGQAYRSSSITKVVFDASFRDYYPVSTNSWFNSYSNLQTIEGIQNLNTQKITNMQNMFYGCINLTAIDLSQFNTAEVENMSCMFSLCRSLTEINVGTFNTAKVTDMQHMFDQCRKLTSLNVSNFNTANVTNMEGMFNMCDGLTALNLANFNTGKVTNMKNMFSYCTGLATLTVSKSFNTANVTTMKEMFLNCQSLTTLDVSNFNTAKVTDFTAMFVMCKNLTALDTKGFQTGSATTMEAMFENCQKITELDLSKATRGSGLQNVGHMFGQCYQLKTIICNADFRDVKDAKGNDATTRMFYGCTAIVGGNGTTWSGYNGSDWARTDLDAEQKGYFTKLTGKDDPKWIQANQVTYDKTYFTYNTQAQAPVPTIKYPGDKDPLAEGTDYTVSYEVYKWVQTQAKTKDKAEQWEQKWVSCSKPTDAFYTITINAEKEVENYTISSGYQTKTANKDKDEKVLSNTYEFPTWSTPQKYKIVITGKGKCLGKTEKEFTISRASITGTLKLFFSTVDDKVEYKKDVTTKSSEFEIKPQNYTGKQLTPNPTVSFTYNTWAYDKKAKAYTEVKDKDGKNVTATITLANGTDYEVKASAANIAVGEDNYVTVTGKGNYMYARAVQFAIVEAATPNVVGLTIVSEADKTAKVKNIALLTTKVEDLKTISVANKISGYTIVGIEPGAFAAATKLETVILPATDEMLTLTATSIPATVNVDVPLALFADYALSAPLADHFNNGKVRTTVTPANEYFTFSAGVDVDMPAGLKAYTVQPLSDWEITADEIYSSTIIANNGILMKGQAGKAYNFYATPGSKVSGDAVDETTDNKSYGENLLQPVIRAKNFPANNYYVLKNNGFHRISSTSDKTPAGKAILKKAGILTARTLAIVDLGTTGINGAKISDEGNDSWYNMNGSRVNAPAAKGIYIKNGKKVIVK